MKDPGLIRTVLMLAACLSVAACSSTPAQQTVTEAVSPATLAAGPNPQMKQVLDELSALGAKPIATLSVEQARSQPTPADAVKEVLRKQGKTPNPVAVGRVEDRTITGPGGRIPVRIYWPVADVSTGTVATPQDSLPIILYIHGGGWVIADLDVYDATPRALVDATGAIVVSTHYRQAPEHTFPSAHEDTWAAWRWTLANSPILGADPRRAAVVGESAGGNMAGAIALRARDEGESQPVHQVLVYPVTDAAVGTTKSEREHRTSAPLNTAALPWFYQKYLPAQRGGNAPYFSILDANLTGLAPATVITAEIDPLLSEGTAYADRLRAAGVDVEARTFEGVTHEFFGMGAVVDEADDAVQMAAARLKDAFDNASEVNRVPRAQAIR